MKVIIEFDLPEDQAIPDVEDIKRLTDPNWLADWWHISDIENGDWEDHEITDDDCREILRRANKYLDSNQGLNWESMQCHIDEYLRNLRKNK